MTKAVINSHLSLNRLPRGAGLEPSTPLAGYILCFLLRSHCLAIARLLRTNQKSLKSISARGACSFHNAVFVHVTSNSAANTYVFARDLALQGRKPLSENRTGFDSRIPMREKKKPDDLEI